MRRLVFLAALLASPAVAETSLNRYGPAPAVDPTQVAGQPMYGPYLNWANKRMPQVPSAAPLVVSTQPTPGPLANAYLNRRLEPEVQSPAPQVAPQPTQMASRYQAPAASTFVPQAPRGYNPLPPAQIAAPRAQPYEPRPAPQPLPDSLYSPQPQAQPPVAKLTPPAPPPVIEPVRQAAPPSSIAERLAAAPPPTASGPGPRLYSVHRGYGLQPDAIPQAQSGTGYVLIGPADGGVQVPDLPQKPEPDQDKPF